MNPIRLEHIDSVLYAAALLAAVTLVATIIAGLEPFCRQQLKIEDVTRLTPLDGLRGILCFAVMCCHIVVTYNYYNTHAWVGPKSSSYTLMGEASVGFFFSITAFLFWMKALSAKGRIAPLPYLRGRVFRLAPLYLFTCVVILAIGARRIDWLAFSTLRALGQMSTLGLLRWTGFTHFDPSHVNAGVAWSLQYEWGFYFALPALAATLLISDRSILLLFAIGFLAIVGPSRAYLFVPGILAAELRSRKVLIQVMKSKAVSVGIILLLLSFPFLTSTAYHPIAVVVSTLIFVPIANGNDLFGALVLRGLRLMGLVSYGVYLMHGIGLYLAQDILIRAKNARHGVEAYWGCAIVLAVLVLIASILTYRFVEWPFIRMEKKLRGPRPSTLDIGTAALAV